MTLSPVLFLFICGIFLILSHRRKPLWISNTSELLCFCSLLSKLLSDLLTDLPHIPWFKVGAKHRKHKLYRATSFWRASERPQRLYRVIQRGCIFSAALWISNAASIWWLLDDHHQPREATDSEPGPCFELPGPGRVTVLKACHQKAKHCLQTDTDAALIEVQIRANQCAVSFNTALSNAVTH